MQISCNKNKNSTSKNCQYKTNQLTTLNPKNLHRKKNKSNEITTN